MDACGLWPQVKALAQGMEIQGVQYKAASASVLSTKGKHAWLRVVLTEGKKHEVKVLLQTFGLRVMRLSREEYGPFHLGSLSKGSAAEVAVPHQLLKMAAAFKQNFPAFAAAARRARMVRTAAAKQRQLTAGSRTRAVVGQASPPRALE